LGALYGLIFSTPKTAVSAAVFLGIFLKNYYLYYTITHNET
jgi:hypothetical protein